MSKRFNVDEIPDLTGKVALVTGGNGGIGLETTRQLAYHGARVYMASRNQDKANKAIQALQEQYEKEPAEKKKGGQQLDLHFVPLDLMDLEACKRAGQLFNEKEEKLDILVCNAGIMAADYQLTKDGVEQQFQTNHLSHFALFHAVAPTMIKAARSSGHPSRVVCLSSIAHTFVRLNPLLKLDYTSLEAVNRKMGLSHVGKYMRYSQSKLANMLFARAINKRFSPQDIRACGVHPGFVASDLYKGTPLSPIAPKLFISVGEGALSTLYAATSKEIEEENGWDNYYVTYGLKGTDNPLSRDPKTMSDLWALSEQVTGLKFDDNVNSASNGEAQAQQ